MAPNKWGLSLCFCFCFCRAWSCFLSATAAVTWTLHLQSSTACFSSLFYQNLLVLDCGQGSYLSLSLYSISLGFFPCLLPLLFCCSFVSSLFFFLFFVNDLLLFVDSDIWLYLFSAYFFFQFTIVIQPRSMEKMVGFSFNNIVFFYVFLK